MPFFSWFEETENENEIKRLYKEASDPHTDCLECKLISCGAFMLSGCFLLHHRNNFGKVNGYVQGTLAMGKFSRKNY